MEKAIREARRLDYQPSAAMTVTEATDYLRVSRASLYRLFASGELKPAKVGGRTLVRRIDADALLERSVQA